METSRNREGAKNLGMISSKMAKKGARYLVFFCRWTVSVLTRYPHFQTILDSKASRRIFELARDQQDELGRQDPEEDEDVIEDDFTRPRTHDLELVDEEDDDEDQFDGFSGDEERELVRAFTWLNFFLDLTLLGAFQEIDEGDIQALDKLLPSHANERKTLADLIFSKLESGGGQTAIIKASNRRTSVSPLHTSSVFSALRYRINARTEC